MFPEIKFRQWYKNLNKNIKLAFVSTFIFGLICHIYMMTNKWVNLDDIVQLVDNMDRTTSGRWFLQFPSAIGSDFSLPWLNGFLTILYTSIMSIFIVKMFNIKSKINTIIISGVLVTFPTLGALMPFMNTQDSYQFGAMLAGIAAYVLINKKRGFIYSTILLTLSLGIYQTYLGYAAGLIFIYMILQLFKNENNIIEITELFIKTGISFLAAIGLYLFISRGIFGYLLVDYKGLDTMGYIPLDKIPYTILNTYVELIKFFTGQEFNYHFIFMKYLFIISFTLILFLIYFIIKKSKLKKNKVKFIIFLLLILPIAVNVIYIMSWKAGAMLRMVYSYTVIIIFPLLLIEYITLNEDKLLNTENDLDINKNNLTKKIFSKKNSFVYFSAWFLTITISLSVYNNIYVTNKAYFKVGETNKSSHAYANRIVTRLEMVPGYTKETKIIFLGNPDSRTRFTKKYDADDIKPFIIANHLTRLYSFKYYPVRFLGFPNWITDYDYIEDEIKPLENKIKSMPLYPAKDSIQMINGKIYIKFKDIKEG